MRKRERKQLGVDRSERGDAAQTVSSRRCQRPTSFQETDKSGVDEPSDDTPKPGASAKPSPPPSSQPPSPAANNGPEKVSHKKGAGKKTKKLGNNQYTKARDLSSSNQAFTSSPHSKKRQLASNPQGASSGDEQLPNGETHTSNSTSKNSPDHNGGGAAKGKVGKGKSKGVNGTGQQKANADEPAERSMATMKRQMEAVAAYIVHAKAEIERDKARLGAVYPVVGVMGSGRGNGEGGEMTTLERADSLARKVEEWQRRFGHLA